MTSSKFHPHAIASLVVAVVFLCVPSCLAFSAPLFAGLVQLAAGVAAVALGVSGRRAVMASDGRYAGEGLAVAGVIIGFVVIVAGFLTTIIGINTW